MSFSVKHVANCFLQHDFKDGIASISPMKLQKLVYCVHGWHLAITDKPAITENFAVWPYGPVEESLYHIFKPFRNSPISDYAKTWDGDVEKAFVVPPESSGQFYDIFDFVVKRYMPFTAMELSAMTHQDGTPWHTTKNLGERVIQDDLIKKHFRGLVA